MVFCLDAQKDQKAAIRETEKNKNRVLREINGKQKNNVDSNSAIAEAKHKIQTNVKGQAVKTDEIAAQKQVVEIASAKVATILAY